MGAPQNIRRHPHLAAVYDYLRHCGADDIEVSRRGRTRVTWSAGGRRLAMSLPTSTGNVANRQAVARQIVRRRYREAGIEVRA